MANPVQFLPGAGRAPGQPSIIYGQVSRSQPVPVALTDPLYVTLPYDPDHAFRFEAWPAVHGVTLPAAGADVVLSFDDQHNMRVVWWAGVTAFPGTLPPSGTAGGDLHGSYPSPTVNTVLGGEVPITSVSALGGVLTGTLPDPGLAGAAHVALVNGTLSWPGASAFSNSLRITLPDGGSQVYGVFTPGGNINDPAFFDAGIITAFAPGNGGVTLQGKSAGGGSPAAGGTMTFSGILWD